MSSANDITLSSLLQAARFSGELPSPLASTNIAGIAFDSREVQPGWLFFAFPGAKTDGRIYATQAMERGAVAVISESPAPEGFTAPWVRVEHGRHTLALAAKAFYGKLDEKINITAVTGTNGKTTVSTLIDSILRTAGYTTSLIGTIEYRLGQEILSAPNTTPESLELHKLLARLAAIGGTHLTMEASSHALDLGRIYGLHVHTAVFTNLTRDHLDYHGTMERYFAAKQLLFTGSGGPPPRFAVMNRDDEYGRQLKAPGAQTLTYGLGSDAMVRARHISGGFNGLKFELVFDKVKFQVRSPLIGKINVYNILAACSAGMTYQLSPEVIAAGIAACGGVPGRFERVDEWQPFAVVVDYSHTDDALRNAIQAARNLHPRKIITVFGCGGDRDRTKRPLMGQAAAELSDSVIITSDNPRSEDPLQIINDAMVGVRRFDTPNLIEPDREAAIRKAIQQASSGDIVLIAGKGHETYQIFKDRTIHFDDRETAREILRSFGYKRKAE